MVQVTQASAMFNSGDYVRVTNTTGDDIEGRHGGIDYLFPVDETVTIPLLAAQHIFGFGVTDKTEAILRLGWHVPPMDKKAALVRLTKIKFEELPDNVVEMMQTRVRRPEITGAGPLAGEGSEAGSFSGGPADDSAVIEEAL